MSIVWENHLDEIYLCRVVRKDDQEGVGILTVSLNGKVLHTEEVGLTFGALFPWSLVEVVE